VVPSGAKKNIRAQLRTPDEDEGALRAAREALCGLFRQGPATRWLSSRLHPSLHRLQQADESEDMYYLEMFACFSQLQTHFWNDLPRKNFPATEQ
jgi:hypothetical protein